MNHRCKNCDTVGKITGASNRSEKTKFIASQWYKDDFGLNHTLLVCCECGAFLDCKFSFFYMLLMFFRRSYITKYIHTIDDMRKNALNYHSQHPNSTLHESFSASALIGSSTVDCLVEHKILGQEFKSQS